MSSDSNVSQNMNRETIEVEKKIDEFWHIPESMAHLEDDLYFHCTKNEDLH